MGGKPANIKHHLEINLPDNRNEATKRDPLFFEYVDQVEELMKNFKH